MATDKIKTFNSIIESFLAQTSEIVGTTFHVYFKKVIKLNALIAIENGIQYMLPFREMIFNKDESYFTDESTYTDKINNCNISNTVSNDKILSEIFRLKDIYYKLDSESIENVWSILQALVQLMIEYCEIKGIAIPELYCPN
jgi:hypothetical protein